MLTEVKAYSAWRSVATLLLDANGRPETDLIQIRNIEGLDPVKASVNTSPYGSVDGSSYVGASVLTRNIVLTIGLNPNWSTWTYESLRKLVYQYFMPKRPTRLVFYSDDNVPVEINGVVESVENNMFSKDPELLVSIICPDPYFTALEPIVRTGYMGDGATGPIEIDYKGTVEAGINVKVTWNSSEQPMHIAVKIVNQTDKTFTVDKVGMANALRYFEMNSVSMQKYVQNVDLDTGIITNLLPDVADGSVWPILQPGSNVFSITAWYGNQDFELTYFERFGGL